MECIFIITVQYLLPERKYEMVHHQLYIIIKHKSNISKIVFFINFTTILHEYIESKFILDSLSKYHEIKFADHTTCSAAIFVLIFVLF